MICPRCKEREVTFKTFYPNGVVSYRCSECKKQEKREEPEEEQEEIH